MRTLSPSQSLSKSKSIVVLCWTLGLLWLSVSVVAADQKPLLQGGAQFSEQLTPVPNQFLEGGIFDNRSLNSQNQRDVWYRVPKRMAGVWHRESTTTTSLTNLQTGQVMKLHSVNPARSDSYYGMQVDKFGGIWQMDTVPSVGFGDIGTHLNAHIFSEQRFDLIDETSANTYDAYLDVTIDKITNRIVTTRQMQANRLLFVENSMLRSRARLRSFNQAGFPSHETTTETNETFVRGFVPLDVSADGKNLRQSFITFLTENGMTDHIPDARK